MINCLPDKPPTRVFRPDTPHDVISAAIVAATLPPGRDILVISSMKSSGDPQAFADRMRVMARVYPWADIIDLSSEELRSRFILPPTGRSRLKRVLDTVYAVRLMRRILSVGFGLDPDAPGSAAALAGKVDELFLCLTNHPDQQAVCLVFPTARKYYFPHGFDSVHYAEVVMQADHYVNGRPDATSLATRFFNVLKRAAFGSDAVLPTRIAFDAAYSFNLPLPGVPVQHDLSSCLNRAAMERIFSQMPQEVRDYYSALAQRCGRGGALLLPPYEQSLQATFEQQAQMVVEFADKLVGLTGVGSLLVKPHPLNSDAEVASILEMLRTRMPKIAFHPVLEHREYPVEIVFAPFSITVCGGIDSSSLRTLKKIYGTTSYCPEAAMLALCAKSPRKLSIAKLWVQDHRSHYVAV